MNTKESLGDSVYAEFEFGRLKLTNETRFGPSDIIYLEPEVYTALVAYVGRIQNGAKNPLTNQAGSPSLPT